MGSDKAELFWTNGQTFLDRAIALLERAGCSRVIVSGDRPGHVHVPDGRPGLGPLSGIASVLEEYSSLTGQMLILPVDMPQLEDRDIRPLLAAAKGRDGANFENTPLPMVLEVTPHLRRAVKRLLEENRRAVRGLADRLDLAGVEPVSRRVFENINSPEDYRSLKENP